MIQRVQSLYLTGGFLAIMSLFLLPFARIIAGSSSGYLFLHNFESDVALQGIYNPMLVLLIGSVTALCFLISVFMYKNRIKQMRFNVIVFFLNCGLIASMFWVSDSLATAVGGTAYYKNIGTVMPLVSMLLLVLSNRAIRKDEIKVRAADRIR